MDPKKLKLTGEVKLQGWSIFREVYLQKMGKVREKIKEKENNLIYHQPEPHLDVLKTFPRGVLKFWKEKCSLKTGVDKSSLPF